MFNRLIAVRYMEVNDLLPSRTRVLSSADGRAEPQIVTSPFDAVLDYTPAEQQQIVALKNDNKLDEAFRLLFLKQCAALGDCLPRLFEQVDDYMPLLLALSFTDKDGAVCIGILVLECRKLILRVVNPTINVQAIDISQMPLIIKDSKEKIINLATKCISISRTDWDSFETSWDFKRHPLV